MNAGGPTVTFYGVRGSTPCDGHQYSRYGGNTSSVALEAPGHAPVIFDLGTGVRAYGDIITARQVADLTANRARSPYEANVLLTHLHWDHVIGLPFFTPAFRPDARIAVARTAPGRRAARRRVRRGDAPALLPDHARPARCRRRLHRRRQRRVRAQRREGAQPLGAPHRPRARIPRRARGPRRSPTSPTTVRAASPTTPTTTCRRVSSSCATASTC